MSFDSSTRRNLAKFVSRVRTLLLEEFEEQIQEVYGIRPDGSVVPMEKLTHLTDDLRSTAALLREQIEHILSGMPKTEKNTESEAVKRVIREQAFTLFNRFCAIRMAEERDLVQESVGRGFQSKGFQVFEKVAGSDLGGTYERYRTFLFCLFDEISLDLGGIFDRFSPMGMIFPRENALREMFSYMSEEELKPLWSEDETIGWIYQYWNTKEEREKMRKASSAPRNSRELAVRNQFFTPRYVVEFLTDNTLGRIWYEMRKGETVLKNVCSYMVRRPTEIFLDPGVEPPTQEETDRDLSQDELLKKPVYIEHREKKDPRDLRILDPACGSGHFLIYAFDLLDKIYEEGWDDLECPASESTGRRLGDEYKTIDELRRAVPKLIIENNLHGIDIDPRAVQITALALWLRAQNGWKTLGVSTLDRSRIEKSNIVTAEPMPGEKDMKEEFISNLKPRVIGQIVELVFEKMELAGEAGTLLKIEEEIRDSVAEAKQEWLASSEAEQQFLFSGMEKPKQQVFRFDFSGVTDEVFWEQVEERILESLRAYAERNERTENIKSGLFANDTARGFSFIDNCRILYDIVLMNPPFGDPSINTKQMLINAYSGYGKDIFTFFVDRGISFLCPNGRLGAITNRTGFFAVTQEGWRKNVLLDKSRITEFVDLGYGVLDAVVETAAYVITKSKSILSASFHRATSFENKMYSIAEWINAWMKNQDEPNSYIQYLDDFKLIPSSRIAFWIPRSLLGVFERLSRYNDFRGNVQVGLQTSDNFRFVRLAWEIPPETVGQSREDTIRKGKIWVYYAKGGEYAPYYADIHLCAKWYMDGEELKNFKDKAGNLICYPRNEKHYFKPGLTYSERTTSNFSLRVLPSGCCFDTVGPRISSESKNKDIADLPVFMTRSMAYILEFMVGSADVVYSGTAARHYTPRSVSELPFPNFDANTESMLADLATEAWEAHRANASSSETDRYFVAPYLAIKDSSLQLSLKRISEQRDEYFLKILRSSFKAEQIVAMALELKEEAVNSIKMDFGLHPFEYANQNTDSTRIIKAYDGNIEDSIDSDMAGLRSNRSITKLSYFADRKLELLCHAFRLSPESILQIRRSNELIEHKWAEYETSNLLSYLLGSVFGRWDMRIAHKTFLSPNLPDSFDPVPVSSPGMLLAPNGLPSTPGNIVSEEWLTARPDANTLPREGSVETPIINDTEYPIRISWDGILVDDTDDESGQSHGEDIVARIREVLEMLWKENASEIEIEACELLSVKSLREYFRKPNNFFADHLNRYSKSRRQAPIYWPLSTESGEYTLWLYYHRLDDQILFKCVTDFVEPKMKEVQTDIDRLRQEVKQGGAKGKRSRLEKLQDLLLELKDLRDELLRVSKFYKPDLNDGVLINAAPLQRLFRLKKWQKKCKECWDKLEAGEYDWAHMAMNLHPDQVREKCRTDKSLAIAHGLEELYQEPENKKKKRKGKRSET